MRMWNRHIHTDTENVHKCSYAYRNPKNTKLVQVRNFYLPFWVLGFSTWGERHNFFNKRAAHFVDPNWSRRSETKNRLPSSRLESQLTRLEFKSQLTVFFSNSQILSASGHDVIHVPGPMYYLGFLLWHFWL